eukprot:gene18796-22475_t
MARNGACWRQMASGRGCAHSIVAVCILSRKSCILSQSGGDDGGYSLKFNHRKTTAQTRHSPKENIMNIAKNMEAIFVAIIAIAAATSLATAAVPKFRAAPAAPAAPAAVVASADQATMHTVYVSAKRLSAAEKAALIPSRAIGTGGAPGSFLPR